MPRTLRASLCAALLLFSASSASLVLPPASACGEGSGLLDCLASAVGRLEAELGATTAAVRRLEAENEALRGAAARLLSASEYQEQSILSSFSSSSLSQSAVVVENRLLLTQDGTASCDNLGTFPRYPPKGHSFSTDVTYALDSGADNALSFPYTYAWTLGGVSHGAGAYRVTSNTAYSLGTGEAWPASSAFDWKQGGSNGLSGWHSGNQEGANDQKLTLELPSGLCVDYYTIAVRGDGPAPGQYPSRWTLDCIMTGGAIVELDARPSPPAFADLGCEIFKVATHACCSKLRFTTKMTSLGEISFFGFPPTPGPTPGPTRKPTSQPTLDPTMLPVTKVSRQLVTSPEVRTEVLNAERITLRGVDLASQLALLGGRRLGSSMESDGTPEFGGKGEGDGALAQPESGLAAAVRALQEEVQALKKERTGTIAA